MALNEPHIDQCKELILEQARTHEEDLLTAAARLLAKEMGLSEMSDNVQMHNWSVTRSQIYRMTVGGKCRIFPNSEINNAKTSIQRLKDIYNMNWRTRKIGSCLKVTRTK